MSFLMNARMGQFPLARLERAEAPGEAFDAVGALGQEFEAPGHIATINWLTAEDLGVPRRPFDVELCDRPLARDGDGWSAEGGIKLDARQNFTFVFTDALVVLAVDDLFCVTGRCTAAGAGTEIYALDAGLNEIPETRQSADSPLGTAFIGPGIFGIQATGAATVEGVVAFGVHDEQNRTFSLMARVAPAVSTVAEYDQQHYLGRDLDAAGALSTRLDADGLARANALAPPSAVLDGKVHREPASRRAQLVLGLEPIMVLGQNFAAILDDPSWSFDSQDARTDASMSICPSTALQQLALSGAVEAATLGTSVTLPMPAPYPFIASLQQIYDEVSATGRLPLPVIRVKGYHRLNRTDVENRQFAALTFVHQPTFSAEPTGARLPTARDQPGTTDIVFVLSRRDRAFGLFPDLSGGHDQFPRERELLGEQPGDGRPRTHLAGGDSADRTVAGLPRIVAGSVELPLDAQRDQAVVLHARDIFGRWGPPAPGLCVLAPLPVQKPGLYPPEVGHHDHDELGLRFGVSWDWSTRTPFDIRLAIATSVQGDPIEPPSAVDLPGFPASSRLSIRFVADAPHLVGDHVPAGASVAVVPNVLADGEMPSPDQRSYIVSIPAGPASQHFRHEDRRWVVIAADAWETVSGQTDDRRSRASHERAEYLDPRAPILHGPMWALVWTSRPDGANRARAHFDLTTLADRPVSGFHAWRAHDNALLDLAATEIFSDSDARNGFISAVLGTRDKSVRLAMIQNAVFPHLRKAAFRKAFVELFEVDRTTLAPHEIELAFPGAQAGLEFVTFSAVSTTGVTSDRLELSNLFAVAVPPRPVSERPDLRVFTPDAGSPLAIANTLVAVVTATNTFEENQVRFFWDDADVLSSDELLHEIPPLSRIDVSEADRLVPGLIDALAGELHVNRMFFLLRTPMRWGHQSLACALARRSGSGALEDLSARSTLVSARLTPPLGPELELTDRRVIGGEVLWSVAARNVDADTYDALPPCLIQIDLLDRADDRPKKAPATLAEFLKSGAKVGPVAAYSIGGVGRLEVRHPADLGGKVVRLALSDPAGRIDSLILAPPSE
jgi:hypothetical protein